MTAPTGSANPDRNESQKARLLLLLLSGKRTGYLKFTSKKGKKYEASLELDDNYRIEMTFKDNKPKK